MKVSVEGLKKELGAEVVLTGGHFLLRSEVDGCQRHSDVYLNKEEIYSDSILMFHVVGELYLLCVCGLKIDSIVGPANGGNKLSIMMAHKFLYSYKEIYAPQTKKTEGGGFCVVGGGEYIRGRNILLVEDIITTGSSVKKLQKLISSMGGNIVRIACIVNRGRVRASDFGLKEDQFLSLYEVDIPSYSTRDCPKELLERPISKKYGAGNGLK